MNVFVTVIRVCLTVLARLGRERGQTMSEYAILIAWVALLVVVGATTLGHDLSSTLNSTAARV
jgi:Flp pilus assembly pilin Flp